MKTPYDEGIKFCLECAENAGKRLRESRRFSLRIEASFFGLVCIVSGFQHSILWTLFIMAIGCVGMIWFRGMGMALVTLNLEHRDYMLKRADDWRNRRDNYLGLK